ncbi:MAG: hypothetical protein ACLRR0_08025 [Subdoligranulum sp.]
MKPPIERMVICDEIDRTFGNGQLTFVYLMQRNKLEQEIKEQAGGQEMKDYLTVVEFAAAGITKQAVYKRIKQDLAPYVKSKTEKKTISK